MICMAVPSEDIVGAFDRFQHCLFVGLPLLTGIRFATRQKWVDEDDCLPKLNLPAGPSAFELARMAEKTPGTFSTPSFLRSESPSRPCRAI